MLLIGVVLNAPQMFEDAEKLLDLGFQNYEMHEIVPSRSVIAHIPLENSQNKTLDLLAKKAIMVPVKDNETQFQSRVEINPTLCPPIEAGEVCGSLSILQDGRELARVDLIAAEAAEALNYLSYLKMIYSRWLK